MTSPDGTLRVDDLGSVARILATNAQDMNALGESAPNVPNAGPSTGAVGTIIGSLAEAMSKATVSAANSADLVEANNQGYVDADQDNSLQIENAGAEGPESPQSPGR